MDTLLYVENLTVSFDGFLALRNLNLIVERDERVRLLIGPHGAIVAVLDQVGLRERAGDLAGTLSHGEQQWLEIAMLLVQEPRLLLLDEPAAGMTRPEKERTGALIEAIVERSACAVMLIEHDMEFVRQIARRGHRVTVLHEGTVLSEGSLDRVQADERVIKAYLGRGKVRGTA